MRGSCAAMPVERLDGEVDARRDHAALVAAVAIDDVEGGRRAEVDHDQRPAVARVRGDGVDQAVGADPAAVD